MLACNSIMIAYLLLFYDVFDDPLLVFHKYVKIDNPLYAFVAHYHCISIIFNS